MQNISLKYCPRLYISIGRIYEQMIYKWKYILENVLYFEASTYHDVTIFEIDGIVSRIKNWIIYKRNITFP